MQTNTKLIDAVLDTLATGRGVGGMRYETKDGKASTKSEVIFENGHYAACLMSDGSLVVTCKRRKVGQSGYGTRLVGESAPIWADNIREAVAAGDMAEASMLCRAIAPPASNRIQR